MSAKTKVLTLALFAPLALASSATSWAQAVPQQQQYQPVPYNWQPPSMNPQNQPTSMRAAPPGAGIQYPAPNPYGGQGEGIPFSSGAPTPPARPGLQGPSITNFVGPGGVHPPSTWDVYNSTAEPAGETTTMPGYAPQGR
jgi:hypothetical protein